MSNRHTSVKTSAQVGLTLAFVLAGCSGSSLVIRDGGTSATTTGGGPPLGTPCTPTAVVDPCSPGGLICDQVTARCRLPNLGEQCLPAEGCASTPAGLGCHVANNNGTAVDLCLIACSDSSVCPYGMSCIDNGDSYCTGQANGDCVPGAVCSLGGVPGQCLSDGAHTVCYVVGSQHTRYGPCDPFALNSQTASLCAAGMICRATPEWLGGFADAGYCYPLCNTGCAADEHCFQPSAAFYSVCRPGLACAIDLDTCPTPESTCLPDDVSSVNGGCLAVTADAGEPGDPCTPPVGVPELYPCVGGACLPGDGGTQCTPLCNRQTGGKPYCQKSSCSPLSSQSRATDVIGDCR
jgi:hypothetical protein